MELYNKFRVVPEEAKKPIGGGRLKGFTDINPMWRIKMLTEAFGMCGEGWYYTVTDKRLEQGANGEIAAFVDINLFVKLKKKCKTNEVNEQGETIETICEEWSMPIYGTGGSSFVANEKNGVYTSDECFKMALTDALSIACKSLGMGADVYFEKDRTKYDQQGDRTPAPPQPAEPKPTTQPTPTAPLADMEQVEIALQNMTESAQVQAYWKANRESHANPEFVKLVTTYGKKLKDAGK